MNSENKIKKVIIPKLKLNHGFDTDNNHLIFKRYKSSSLSPLQSKYTQKNKSNGLKDFHVVNIDKQKQRGSLISQIKCNNLSWKDKKNSSY